MFKTFFRTACASAMLFAVGGVIAAPADDARTHFQAIGSGDLAVVVHGYADNAQFNWVGGPLDGTYASPAAIHSRPHAARRSTGIVPSSFIFDSRDVHTVRLASRGDSCARYASSAGNARRPCM